MPNAVLGDESPATGRPVARRIDNLDVLRGITAFGVLAIHSYSLGGRDAPIRAQHGYDMGLFVLASGVWMFFAISGFGIAKAFVDRICTGRPRPPVVPFAIRRILRIYPLFWIVLTAMILVIHATVPTWALVLHYSLYNNLAPEQQESILSPAWTLTLEIIFYTVLPAFFWAVTRSRRTVTPERLAAIVIATWVASVVFASGADMLGDGEIGLWLREAFPSMWQAFCPGMLLAIVPHLTSARWRRWLVEFPVSRAGVSTAVVLYAVGLLLSARGPLQFGIPVYQLSVDITRPMFGIAFGIVMAFALRARSWSRHSHWILDVGLASYAVYLIHPVVISVLERHGWAPVPHNTLVAFIANTAVVAAIVIAISLASWRFFEHPLIEYSRTLGARWIAWRGAG